jgi:DNA-binding MarR family transcriptional regulator
MDAAPRELGDELVQVLRPLRRALVRATRAVEGLPSLTEAQVALLRVLVRAGPLSPARVAAELHLARSTVSNLVKELDGEGLVDRRPSALDGRSVVLAPTGRARELFETFNSARGTVLSRALAEIPAEDRERLAAALPSLRRLLERLMAMGDVEEREQRR